jgi:hypothetical protein
MRLLLLILSLLVSIHAVNAGPAPYASAKIYILTDDSVNPPPTPDYIRKHANIVMSLDVYTVESFKSLHWEKAKRDPAIKQQAAPLVMIIDLYDRVQPQPPKAPRFDTLYCTRMVAYSDEDDYIDISAFTSKTLLLPVQK